MAPLNIDFSVRTGDQAIHAADIQGRAATAASPLQQCPM